MSAMRCDARCVCDLPGFKGRRQCYGCKVVLGRRKRSCGPVSLTSSTSKHNIKAENNIRLGEERGIVRKV